MVKDWCFVFCLVLCQEWSSGFMQIGPFGPPDNNVISVRTLNNSTIPQDKYPVLDFVGLVNRNKYPAEEHQITTSDGYILLFHRIPGSPLKPEASGKPVAFVQHGLLCSSDIFAVSDPSIGLVYLLADKGYDVWVGNIRGNVYGRSHVKLSPDTDPEFWKFTIHEMATIDAKEMIDYILNVTGEPSLIFVGHSMGVGLSNLLQAIEPEYNKKVRLVIALAPASLFIRRVPSWAQFVVNTHKQFETLISSAVLHAPAGTSVQIFRHLIQCILSGKLRPFDFGKEGNYAAYNQSEPPEYDLGKVTSPMAVFYGSGDVTAITENLDDFVKQFPNVIAYERVPNEKFGHMDFIFGKDARKLLYNRVVQIMEQYSI